MAKRKKVGAFGAVFIIFVASAIIITLSSYSLLPFYSPTWDEIFGKAVPVSVTDDSDSVHFIDCNQGDSAVIISNKSVTVIDTGPSKFSNVVVKYLKNQNIKKVDNLILTHPHEDHIGGAKAIIENFIIGGIYMKKPKDGKEPTTKVYENLLEAIASKNLKITDPNNGSNINNGDFLLKIIGPVSDFEDTNNQSLIIKATYNNADFLFMGDAEADAEKALSAKYKDELKTDVLKVGHHGSSTSSTKEFLNLSNPDYAIISCGEGNSYGHPHGTALKRLKNINTKIYRTDLKGNIVAFTDGNSITFKTEK